MMGWRVGFVLADRAICEQATKIQDAMIICAPMISQMVAEGAVREEWDYARGFTASSSGGDTLSPQTRRDSGSGGRRPVAGSSHSPASPAARTPPHSPGVSSRTCTSLDPGAAFGQSGEGCLRLSFGSVSGEGLVEGLDRLEDYFARGG